MTTDRLILTVKVPISNSGADDFESLQAWLRWMLANEGPESTLCVSFGDDDWDIVKVERADNIIAFRCGDDGCVKGHVEPHVGPPPMPIRGEAP